VLSYQKDQRSWSFWTMVMICPGHSSRDWMVLCAWERVSDATTSYSWKQDLSASQEYLNYTSLTSCGQGKQTSRGWTQGPLSGRGPKNPNSKTEGSSNNFFWYHRGDGVSTLCKGPPQEVRLALYIYIYVYCFTCTGCSTHE